MRLIADTNILVRAVVNDDAPQSRAAHACLLEADTLVLTLTALCEFAWVLRTRYRIDRADVARALRTLVESQNAVCDQPAVALGLKTLDAGGDFADGVIAASGTALGGDTFVSFDRRAVKLLAQTGQATRLLA